MMFDFTNIENSLLITLESVEESNQPGPTQREKTQVRRRPELFRQAT